MRIAEAQWHIEDFFNVSVVEQQHACLLRIE
jgi:hypothetical protein